jgi:hypothetical protein
VKAGEECIGYVYEGKTYTTTPHVAREEAMREENRRRIADIMTKPE